MKHPHKQKQPEVLRDTSHLSPGTKRLGIASICGLSLLLGFLAGAVVWVVLRIMLLGIDALWTWLPDLLGCGRSIPYNLIVCLAGGLLIGLIQRQVGPLPDNMEQVMGRIKLQGGYPYDRLHIIAVCALLPLIFGGALGPEAGLTGLVAGLCCLIGDRLKCKGDQIVALTEAGFAATLGVIFHAPLFGVALNLEPDPDDPSEHARMKIVRKRTRIVIYCFGVLGGMLAFGALGRLLGGGSGLPRFNAEHAIGLSQWKWFLPLLALGVAFSLFYMLVERLTRRMGERLRGEASGDESPAACSGSEAIDSESPAACGGSESSGSESPAACGGGEAIGDEVSCGAATADQPASGRTKSWRPVISCLIPGIFMALCGYFLPMTMFSGEHQLEDLIEGWPAFADSTNALNAAASSAIDGGSQALAAADLSGPLSLSPFAALLLTAILKLALVSLCINFGWRGGSIFPLIFSGACLGYAFALMVGMDGAFAAAVVISALYAYQMRKPVAVIMVLLLCFPVTYIVPVGITAFVAAKIPSPFARQRELTTEH